MTMTAVIDAASGGTVDWHSINWAKAHSEVRQLQVRIAKAVREKRWRKVNSLQWTLTHSFYGKALAVKRVTGVDKETWSTPKCKSKAVCSLRRRGYKPMPLRRV
jgi:RNA-directed DNA polymerase